MGSVGATPRGCPGQRFRHQDAMGQARGLAPTDKTYPCKGWGIQPVTGICGKNLPLRAPPGSLSHLGRGGGTPNQLNVMRMGPPAPAKKNVVGLVGRQSRPTKPTTLLILAGRRPAGSRGRREATRSTA